MVILTAWKPHPSACAGHIHSKLGSKEALTLAAAARSRWSSAHPCTLNRKLCIQHITLISIHLISISFRSPAEVWAFLLLWWLLNYFSVGGQGLLKYLWKVILVFPVNLLTAPWGIEFADYDSLSKFLYRLHFDWLESLKRIQVKFYCVKQCNSVHINSFWAQWKLDSWKYR